MNHDMIDLPPTSKSKKYFIKKTSSERKATTLTLKFQVVTLFLSRKYHNEVKPGISNLFNDDYKTKTRRFIEHYTNLENTTNPEEIFEMASAAVNKELDDKKLAREQEKDANSLAKSFKTAKDEHKKIDIGEIMKDT